MADRTRLLPKVGRWVGALTHEARKAWHNGHGPEVLGKIGFWVAVPGLDAAYQRHLAVLRQTRRTVAAVATSAKRLELRIGELERRADDVADHSQGEGQAARNAAATLAELRRAYAEAKAREERVSAASRRLMIATDAVRQAKDAAKAAHTAAEEAAQAALAEIRNSQPPEAAT
jgi:Sec-independent protein translocase protein TatA